MKLVSVTISTRHDKKLMATFIHKGKYTIVHFGERSIWIIRNIINKIKYSQKK